MNPLPPRSKFGNTKRKFGDLWRQTAHRCHTPTVSEYAIVCAVRLQLLAQSLAEDRLRSVTSKIPDNFDLPSSHWLRLCRSGASIPHEKKTNAIYQQSWWMAAGVRLVCVFSSLCWFSLAVGNTGTSTAQRLRLLGPRKCRNLLTEVSLLLSKCCAHPLGPQISSECGT